MAGLMVSCMGMEESDPSSLQVPEVKTFEVKDNGSLVFELTASPAYLCDRQGMTDGGIIWATGEQRKSRMLATGGALFRVAKWFYPYVGAGYGSRNVYWQDYEGQWAKVGDFSCKGIALEVGTIFKLGPVAISAGVSNTAFKFTEVEVGVGLMF